MNEGNVNFKVLAEKPLFTKFKNYPYFQYQCEISTFPYIGRIVYVSVVEGRRLVPGNTYAGKIRHRHVKDYIYVEGAKPVYAELSIRRDI